MIARDKNKRYIADALAYGFDDIRSSDELTVKAWRAYKATEIYRCYDNIAWIASLGFDAKEITALYHKVQIFGYDATKESLLSALDDAILADKHDADKERVASGVAKALTKVLAAYETATQDELEELQEVLDALDAEERKEDERVRKLRANRRKLASLPSIR